MSAIGTYPASYKDGLSLFAENILPKIRQDLRVAGQEFDDEILSYIKTSATDLKRAGIVHSFFDPSDYSWECDFQILQAIKWYCRSVFGLYNADMEKYAKAYASLKATLCTQRFYTEEDHGV